MELNVTQLRKSSNEIRQEKKRYSKKGWHTKRNLWNSTRFDLKNQNNNTTETNCCGPKCVIFTDLW